MTLIELIALTLFAFAIVFMLTDKFGLGVVMLCIACLLAGCGWDMYPDSWEQAATKCEPYGGLLAADDKRHIGRIEALCKDGTRVEFARVKQ